MRRPNRYDLLDVPFVVAASATMTIYSMPLWSLMFVVVLMVLAAESNNFAKRLRERKRLKVR